MSLVVFPFNDEDVDVVGRNLAIAANHDRVDEVWAVAADVNNVMSSVAGIAPSIASGSGIPVRVFPQERIGILRPGKGDGMNTALIRSAERGFDRTHFYDADITNFDDTWIDGAEEAADRGYGVVRHRFPRAATDAMITWMITRPGLAKLFPGTVLPQLGQPLGGELALSHEVVVALAEDPFVAARSDWGIDTVITHGTATLGEAIYEHNAPDGKRHALYGSLIDIKDMVLECLDAVRSLRSRPEAIASFEADPPNGAPTDLKATVAYDMAATLSSISEPPDDEESEVLNQLGHDPDDLSAIDEDTWGHTLDGLLAGFHLGEKAWEEAAYRLWVLRVVHYTLNQVPRGYDRAIEYLDSTIRGYEAGS